MSPDITRANHFNLFFRRSFQIYNEVRCACAFVAFILYAWNLDFFFFIFFVSDLSNRIWYAYKDIQCIIKWNMRSFYLSVSLNDYKRLWITPNASKKKKMKINKEIQDILQFNRSLSLDLVQKHCWFFSLSLFLNHPIISMSKCGKRAYKFDLHAQPKISVVWAIETCLLVNTVILLLFCILPFFFSVVYIWDYTLLRSGPLDSFSPRGSTNQSYFCFLVSIPTGDFVTFFRAMCLLVLAFRFVLLPFAPFIPLFFWYTTWCIFLVYQRERKTIHNNNAFYELKTKTKKEQ